MLQACICSISSRSFFFFSGPILVPSALYDCSQSMLSIRWEGRHVIRTTSRTPFSFSIRSCINICLLKRKRSRYGRKCSTMVPSKDASTRNCEAGAIVVWLPAAHFVVCTLSSRLLRKPRFRLSGADSAEITALVAPLTTNLLAATTHSLSVRVVSEECNTISRRDSMLYRI
jgi:hypothetical protein